MPQDSDSGEMIMSLREWRQAIRTPTTYRVGNSTLRIQTQFVSLVAFIGLLVLLILYTYAIDHHSSDNIDLIKSKPSTKSNNLQSVAVLNIDNYNNTYPLTTPIRTPKGMQYRIGMVSDLDKESKSETEDFTWLSYYKKGTLLWNPVSNNIKVTWDLGEPSLLKSTLGESGRGMELSELIVFNGKLYTVDDRTGIVYELLDDKVIPFVMLNDGDGHMNKGFKSEWAAVKNKRLFVGGLGKEWTTNTGEAVNTYPQWIKTISPTGEVEHHNWYQKYLALRRVLGIEFPGYVTHEAVVWSDVHDRWFFLPRRCSKESYNDVLDESRGCNVMITADDSFRDIKVNYIGSIIPTHGFSSFRFIPGSSDQVIVAVRSEENKGATATYIMGFDITGKILLPETKIADKKFGLPQQICYECLSRIELFHSYKQSCLESQHTLKHWNLFCDGGSVPQDVDIFSGRSRSPDAHNTSILAKRMRAENIVHHFKSSEVLPARKSPHLSSPVMSNSNTVTPPKRKNINSMYTEQLREISPQNRKQSLPDSPSRRALNLEYSLKEADINSSKQSAGKPLQDRQVETTAKSNASCGPRARTPVKEIKSSASEARKQAREKNVKVSSQSRCAGARTQSPSEKTQNQLTSSNSMVSETRSQLKSLEKIATKSCSVLPAIQIISIESLAKVPEKSKTKFSPENDKNTESARPFAPTISEMVKQRKRSNSVSMQSYASIKKPRKPRTRSLSALSSGSVGKNKENSAANLNDWLSDKDDDNVVQRESDARSVQSIDDSTQALLRLLESDDDDDDFCQSDCESFISDNSRPGTPSLRNPMNAYVKVEKLASDDDAKLRVRTEEELNVGVPVSRMGRPRQQSNQYRLVKVVKDEATGRERYKCLKCGSLLSNKCYIKEHMKIHTGDKDFKCQKCGKAFRNNYMLKAHDAVHLRDRKYSCSTCGSTFVQRDRLRQHFRVHAAEQLECTICGHKTNQKSALRRHMRIHTGERPYECEFCGGKYTDRSTWVNHRRIHTGERPFSCKECGKTFSRIVYLQGHMRSHSNERPFPCHLCPSSFKTKAHLVKHLTCVHKDLMQSVVDFIKDEFSTD